MAAEDTKEPTATRSSGMPADPVESPGPEYKVQPRSGGEDDMNATGKYLLIGVPQFAKDPISGNLMTSYLRLGASSSTWDQDPGGWLAGMIHQHGPPGGHLNAANLADQAKTNGRTGTTEDVLGNGVAVTDMSAVDTSAEARSTDRVFIDDDRKRVGGMPHELTEAARVEQSRVIHTRGGWRDHSDGNRISTTYGDKIEVVRGNYKMIVMGRQDDPTASTGWDASGQHIQDFGYTMPGASVRVEESTNYTDKDGNFIWHLQNTTEGVVQSSNFAGDFFTYTWGDKKWDFIGSPDPQDKHPETGYPRKNPHILEKTWAQKIESYTGSAAWRIPTIKEETWALTTASLTDVLGAIIETTNAGSTASTTTVVGSVSESTTVGDSVTETTSVTNSITSTTTAATTDETTTVGAASSISTIGASSSVAAIGVESDISVKGAALGVTVVGAQADVTVAGVHAELELAIAHATVEICPLRFDFFLGAQMSIQLGAFLEIKAGVKREIGSLKDTTEATITNTCALYKVTAAMICLG